MAAKTLPLNQPQSNLCSAADAATLQTDGLQPGFAARKSSAASSALAVAAQAEKPAGCRQSITMSFYFDGTGNNMDADTPTDEHSNIARLFRAHPLDEDTFQTYARYIPGIGTYFKEIGDPGGTTTGRGMGAWGQARLDWAFKELGNVLRKAEARATNPSNKIVSVRLAVFGFSRGAALARAFCRDLQASCARSGAGFAMRTGALARSGMTVHGGYPVEVYFLGIFDTVASVGLPMSANNVAARRNSQLSWGNVLRGGSGDVDLLQLAFGEPGADPAPGPSDGHGTWADGLKIAAIVGRCVHMVAAHEMRNSFPLDSALDGSAYPASTVEMVYPGVHSDVGGGYRQGEGGKSAMLSQVPLRAMLQEAVEAGVPLRDLSHMKAARQLKDFALDERGSSAYDDMLTVWRGYMQQHNGRVPLGRAVLSHMAEYWRYRLTVAVERSDPAHAGRPGRSGRARVLTPEQQTIERNEKVFANDRKSLEQDLRQAQVEQARIAAQLQGAEDALEASRQSPGFNDQSSMWEGMVKSLGQKEAAAADTTRRAQARLDTAANDAALIESLDTYDAWLLEDAKLLYGWHRDHPNKRMRPHYKALAEAYREVVVEGRRMPTASHAYRLFNTFVHDSLAGFAQDNTRPSDPRVLYVGGDLKKDYALRSVEEPGAALPA